MPEYNYFCPNTTTLPEYKHFTGREPLCKCTTNFARIQSLFSKYNHFSGIQSILCEKKNSFPQIEAIFPNTTNFTQENESAQIQPYLPKYNYVCPNTTIFAKIQPFCPNTTTVARIQQICPSKTTFARIQPVVE